MLPCRPPELCGPQDSGTVMYEFPLPRPVPPVSWTVAGVKLLAPEALVPAATPVRPAAPVLSLYSTPLNTQMNWGWSPDLRRPG